MLCVTTPWPEKECTKCKRIKAASAFQKRTSVKSGLASWCRKCVQTHNIAKGPKRRKDGKEKAIAYKGGKCQMCGGVFPSYCYDFHHRDPSKKDMNMTDLHDKAWYRVEQELDKCDLLCANCHRITHHGAKN